MVLFKFLNVRAYAFQWISGLYVCFAERKLSSLLEFSTYVFSHLISIPYTSMSKETINKHKEISLW